MIANTFNISNPNLIFAGRSFAEQNRKPVIGRPSAGGQVSSTSNTYTVVLGDTLYGIARRFNTTVSSLVALNNIPNKDLIYVGKVLNVSKPSAKPAPEASKPVAPKPEEIVDAIVDGDKDVEDVVDAIVDEPIVDEPIVDEPVEDEVIVTTGEVMVVDDIAFETLYIQTNDLFVGEEDVYEIGQIGQTVTIYDVTYENGVEVSRNILSQTTVDPVDRVILVGTREEASTDVVFTHTQIQHVSKDLPDGTTEARIRVIATIGNGGGNFNYDDISHVIAPDGSIHSGQTDPGGKSFGDMSNPHEYLATEWLTSLYWNLPKTSDSIGDYTFTVVDVNGVSNSITVTVTEDDLI